LRSSRIPRIFQVPGPLHLENVFFRKLEIGLSQKKQDYWIGTCKWTNERYLKSGVKSDHLFLCYYGMDMEYVKRYPGILKQTLGLKETDIVVGMVAYVYAPKKILGQKQGLKGHEDFIDAISLLLDKYPNLYGVCIGGAATDKAVKYEQTIKKYALTKCGDRIIFLGTRTDVPQLYGNMDIAVHPSHSENLGGAAESLLLEVPTITSTVGGFPDIIHDKENGLLVPPHNPVELSKAISAMLEGQYDLQSFKEKGKTLMLEMLDVKDTARILISVYNKILEQNSRKNV
ncbi:MAG: glycosyltransferase family 4 protein, partial [Bacteroidales bacterium]|nr:glycosyltransferase family 4 protein [Bacteroidales bacterium]